MKRLLFTAQFIALLLCLMAQTAWAQNNEPFSINESPLPKPTSPFMDYVGVIDSATKEKVEQSILKLKEETNPPVELAVAIVKTTGDRPIFDYSLAVARGWGIGSREQDNPGALLLIAVDDRKYYTQVSSDLEDELPDGLVGSLQRQYLVPQFKKGNYSKGVEDTINAYIDVINSKNIINNDSGDGEFVPSSGTRDTNGRADDYSGYNDNDFDCSFIFPCLIMLGILIFIIISNSGGGGGGGKKRRKHYSTGDNVAGDIVTGILAGLITGGSSGGSSSSDWGGGGGSSGGGWGGFGGGGDFGGGGAGGGW